MLKKSKICNIIFWIENDSPPSNSSDLVAPPFPQVHVCGEHQKRCFARFKAEKVHFQVHVLPGVYVHVQLCISGARRKRCRAVGNIRKGAQLGLKQKRCIFRCMCCQVLACMCKCALPGARRWERQRGRWTKVGLTGGSRMRSMRRWRRLR